MIFGVAITNRVTKTLSGKDRDYTPVRTDLSEGWTLNARKELAAHPAKLALIGRRYTYIAQLGGYQLPAGMCSCEREQCVCRHAQPKPDDEPGVLLLIGARARRAWDGSEQDVLRNPRYYEQFEQTHGPLENRALLVLTGRWHDAHERRAARRDTQIGRWQALNEIRAFVAHEHGAIVPLAQQAWDPDRLAEGQLVLHTKDAGAAASAARDFTYRLPNLDVPLRVEDTNEEGELVIDCGEEDLIRVEQYLKAQNGKPLRLTLDQDETDRQIERERWTLGEAERRERLRTLIARPTLARVRPEHRSVGFLNPHLDEGQRTVVSAANAAQDVLIVQGPPGTGKTTAICEIVRQALTRDPHAQILLAAQTHQAVDHALLRLSMQDPDLPIVRVASVHTIDRVDQTVRERYWTDSPEPWPGPIVSRALAYRQLIELQTAAGDRTEDGTMRKVLAVQEDYLASIGPQRTPAQRLAQARVIAGTCAGVQSDQRVREMTFTLAILEEAGKATPPDALTIALRSNKTILVGDSRQLPPHIWDPMRTVLRNPAELQSDNPNRQEQARAMRRRIEALGNTPAERERADQETLFEHYATHLQGTPSETTLTTQYRMLPEIGQLIGEVFYKDIGGLQHGRNTPADPRIEALTKGTRVKLIDIPGREQYEGKSKHRDAEIAQIRKELATLQESAASIDLPANAPQRLGVAVITPYAAQARRLRQALDLTNYPALNVRIGIVDRFQGDEDQVVIVSVTATTVAGFLKIPNRINVALSRAQDLLIIATSLKAAIDGKIGAPLQQVARFIQQQVENDTPGYEIVHALAPTQPAQTPAAGRKRHRARSGRPR
jgi:ATP-dependent RNA/DNA helicase IGHMBP2